MSDKTARIRELNDQFRKTLAGGRIVLTQGIQAMAEIDILHLLGLLQTYDDFSEGDDPYGEHDFGAIMMGGQKYFWKIDYYDNACEMHSPDPSDPAVTHRVLTLMLAEEY